MYNFQRSNNRQKAIEYIQIDRIPSYVSLRGNAYILLRGMRTFYLEVCVHLMYLKKSVTDLNATENRRTNLTGVLFCLEICFVSKVTVSTNNFFQFSYS